MDSGQNRTHCRLNGPKEEAPGVRGLNAGSTGRGLRPRRVCSFRPVLRERRSPHNKIEGSGSYILKQRSRPDTMKFARRSVGE